MTAQFISIIVVVLALLGSSVRTVRQYEKGVVLRFGRLLPTIRQPGLRLIIPIADRMRKVSMQTVVMGIPSQGAITRDDMTLSVDAVVCFRVIDPIKAIINVQHYPSAVSQVAQTLLRSVIGRADLDTLLSQRDQINAELTAALDALTEGPWGLHIERVAINDVTLPEGRKRFPVDLLRFLAQATATHAAASKMSTEVPNGRQRAVDAAVIAATAATESGPVLGSGVIPSPRSARRER